MNVIFIAGTDTGIGKTVVTKLLRRYLSDKGYNVTTQKWVETGVRRPSVKKGDRLLFSKSSLSPYIFAFPGSPHLAARLENRKIDMGRIEKSLRILSKQYDFVIVEGTGGLLVPIDEKNLFIDMVKKLGLPVLLVAGNRLGAINHTLLSAEALTARKIKVLGIIFNDLSKKNKIILKDNPRIVNKFTGGMVLGALPFSYNPLRLQKEFDILGERILARYE